MKIVFVHEKFGKFAGAEQNIYLTGQALKEVGHELSYIFDHKSHKEVAQFDTLFNDKVRISFSEHRREAREKASFSLKQALREIEPDLIYLHKCGDLNLIKTIVDSGVPVVRMVHDHDVYCLRSYRYFPLSRKVCRRKAGLYCCVPCLAFLLRDRKRRLGFRLQSPFSKLKEINLLKKMSLILAGSEYMKTELQTQGLETDCIKVLPPVSVLKSTDNSDFEPAFKNRNILFVGQIIKGKGVDCLIRSVSMMEESCCLNIIGTGSHEKYCRNLVQDLGLDQKVKFLGWIDQSKLKDYFREANVVAFPSVWPEPFGMVGLEAMQMKLPVVAFDAGGVRDWLRDGHNGFLIKWMDIEAFAISLDRLLANRNLARKMGQKGYDMVQSEFRFESYIQQLEAIFFEFIQKS